MFGDWLAGPILWSREDFTETHKVFKYLFDVLPQAGSFLGLEFSSTADNNSMESYPLLSIGGWRAISQVFP